MQRKDILDIKKQLDHCNIMLTFAGPFTQEIIEDLGVAIRRYMETEKSSKSRTYNVFSVFIEQSQNIKNYIKGKNEEFLVNSGMVVIGKDAGGYFVYSGNLISEKDVVPLETKIGDLLKMNAEELKVAYKEQIKTTRNISDERHGAGLGLIDIARKATRPIEYEFAPYTENPAYRYFIMKVTI